MAVGTATGDTAAADPEGLTVSSDPDPLGTSAVAAATAGDASSGEASTPSVSVVIPSFRRADRLISCLDALAAQDHPRNRFEVIVVDDGSPDPLAPAAETFRDRLEIRVHRQANAGPAIARNVGAALAEGDLLVFTDDDCRPHPGWLSALARAHHADPDAMLGGHIVNAIRDSRCAEASQLLVSFVYEWFGDDHASRFFASNNLAAPREGYFAVGGFDTTFPRPGGEDRELCERWRRSGRRLVEVPDAVIDHHHTMGLRGLIRQHWNYGRGAYDVHRRRAQAGGGGVRLEPLRFYVRLVTYPFGRVSRREAVPLAALLVLCQAANAAGFAAELIAQRRAR